VNEIDLSSQTALHMAAESGYQEIVEILLANGASIDAVGGIGRTALHFGNS
jgi:ankyrin repeat protein